MSQHYAPSSSSSNRAQQQQPALASPSTPTVAATTANGNGDYFQQSHPAASPVKSGGIPAGHDFSQQEKLAAMEEHQKRFAEARDSLVGAIDETGSVLTSLRDFNKQRWIVHYPAIDRKAATTRKTQLRRSQSTAPGDRLDEEEAVSEVDGDDYDHHHAAAVHPGIHRCITEAAPQHMSSSSSSSAPTTPMKSHSVDVVPAAADIDEDAQDANASEMSVLRLDLKLGAAGNQHQALVRSLEKSSVAQLLDERMTSSIRQLDSLRERISDTQSKVLVTGDLNAGKSTFVNALMRRKLMPVDQQPCTTVFCEVLDAEQVNEGREEVHLIHPGMCYDVQNDNTYTRHSLDDIEDIVAEAEDLSPEDAPMIKCYCHDTRATQESLLRNGIVDIALIDAPGLNRDSLKTTALFARQEQIDVVVFVVSAENHFTLSAKEFLWNASNDKAYIFIVVNKFDQIRNKEKCKRLVLEQIKQLSPRTYEDAEELVHFVDSGSVFGDRTPTAGTPAGTPAEESKVAGDDVVVPTASETSFAQLEACLRDFVLQRREKSKLMPAQTYLLRLLSDIEYLSQTNLRVATAELEEARRQLEAARPALAQCQAAHAKMEVQLESEEDGVVANVSQEAASSLDRAVELIGDGKPASSQVDLPPYPGFFSALDYAAAVRDAFLCSLEAAVIEAEEAARGSTAEAVTRIQQMGEAHLPSDVERTQRQFRPEAMFSKRLRRLNAGVVGLGLAEEISQARISDIFDAQHYIQLIAPSSEEDDGSDPKKALKVREEEVSLISGLSLGLGAMTLVGGKAYGAKSAIDAFIHLSNFIGNPSVRRWAPSVIGVATAGMFVYIIYDLPQSIPRNVGRSMKRDLTSTNGASKEVARGNRRKSSMIDGATTIVPSSSSSSSSSSLTTSNDAATFTSYHRQRLSREVRKVLRLAGYDLQERFRVALAERKGTVDRLEGQEKKSADAIEWFTETSGKVKVVRTRVSDVEIA